MSAFGREAVYAALFSYVQGALTASPTPAVTVSRVPVHYSAIDASQMPAVYQMQKGESIVRKRGLDSKYTLRVDLLVYTAGSSDSTVPPSTQINNIIDTIDAALSVKLGPENNQTLGLPNVVQHAWIEGDVQIFEAVSATGLSTSVAIIPVHILVAA